MKTWLFLCALWGTPLAALAQPNLPKEVIEQLDKIKKLQEQRGADPETPTEPGAEPGAAPAAGPLDAMTSGLPKDFRVWAAVLGGCVSFVFWLARRLRR